MPCVIIAACSARWGELLHCSIPVGHSLCELLSYQVMKAGGSEQLSVVGWVLFLPVLPILHSSPRYPTMDLEGFSSF